MDEPLLLWLLLPVIISKRFVITCAYVCVRAWQRTKSWWISPCVSCYTQVHAHLWFACVSSNSAHISVAQTGAVDGHAETCSVLNRDIFGLLCYWETSCWRNFLYKVNRFFLKFCPKSGWLHCLSANFLHTVYCITTDTALEECRLTVTKWPGG